MYAGLTSGIENFVTPPVVSAFAPSLAPRRTLLTPACPMLLKKSCETAKRVKAPARKMPPPTAMFAKRYLAAPAPRCPALWISAAAVDSGNGRVLSSTIARRTSETNSTPKTEPTIMRTVDLRYADGPSKDGHAPAIRHAGIGKIGP